MIVLFIVTALTLANVAECQLLEGIYCGKQNCYDILNVTRDSTKLEIARNYRQLARKYHPDLHRTIETKKTAEEQFKIVATAYEILKDDESRTDYDYMLDHPDEYYANYYRYYRRRVAPKVDVRLVLAVLITVISIIQYYSAWQRYEEAIKYFMTLPKYRNHALDMAKQDGLMNTKGKRKTRNEQKTELEAYVRRYIEQNMDIKGSYAKPTIVDILWIRLIIFPYTLVKYVYWYVKWHWDFDLMKKPYGTVEKLYLIRKYMKMGANQFDALDEKKINEYLNKELWLWDKFLVWRAQEEENMKKQLAESAKYKAYRRYVKNHGLPRMTFED